MEDPCQQIWRGYIICKTTTTNAKNNNRHHYHHHHHRDKNLLFVIFNLWATTEMLSLYINSIQRMYTEADIMWAAFIFTFVYILSV